MNLVAVLIIGVIAALAITTGVGQYRREHSVGLAIGAALVFPAAWVAWYVLDELPDRWRRLTD